MRKINTVVIHCSATPPSRNVDVEEIRRWHTEDRGWSDVGYHYIIRRDAVVETGRPLGTPGAHVKGHNAASIGICLAGGVDESDAPEANFTVDQMWALRKLLMDIRKDFPAVTKVLGHRDFPGVKKACPCFDVREWLWSINLQPKETFDA